MSLEYDSILNVHCDHEGCGECEYNIGGWDEEPEMPEGWAHIYERVLALRTQSGFRTELREYCPEHAPLHTGDEA